jgi:hypothetical protein
VKTIRFWLAGLGITAALAALILTTALVPAVQRWAVLGIAASRPGLKLDVDRLSIRPGFAEVHNLRAQNAGMRVDLADATFEISLWQAFAHRRLVLGNAVVNGLKVDLTPTAPPAVAVAGGAIARDPVGAVVAGHRLPAAAIPGSATLPAVTGSARPFFDGIFKHLQLPCEVVLDSCKLDGTVLIPREAAALPTEARVKLTGGHFGPGREARFEFDANIRHPGPGSPVDLIEAQGVLTAALGRPTVIERLGVHFDASATGPFLSVPARLQADGLLERTQAGETYSVSLKSFEGGVVNRLLALDGSYVAGSSKLAGSWQVQANNRDVAPFAFGMQLPDFSVSGEGHFGADFVTLDLSLDGRLTGDANRLEIVDPHLRELGALGAMAVFNVEFGRGELRVTDLGVDVNGPSPVLALHAVQPFTVNLKTGETTTADARHELVRITLDGVPAKWVQPFFPDFAVVGGEIDGELVAALHGTGRMWLRTTSPLRIRGLAMDQTSWIPISAADVSLDAEAEYAASETRIRVTRVDVTTPEGDRVGGQGELTMRSGRDEPEISVQADFDASLSTLFRAEVPVGGVTARGVVAFSRSDKVLQVDRVEAHVTAADGRTLFDVSSLEAFRVNPTLRTLTAVEGGPGEVLRVKFGRMPVRLKRSDLGALQLSAEIAPGQCIVRTEADGFKAAMAGPLRLEAVSAELGGRGWLKNVAVEIEPSLTCSSRGAAIELAGLRVKNAAGENILFAKAAATAGVDPDGPKFEGSASFDLSVPAMAGQPLFENVETPRQGKLTGDVKFVRGDNLLCEGQLTLNGLVSAASGEPLPVANVSFRAGLNDKGEIAFQAPILIDRAGERSDLTLGATLRPAAGGRAIDAKLTSDHLVIDDVLLMARAFHAASRQPVEVTDRAEVPATNPAHSVAPVDPVAHLAPAWSGIIGLVQLDLRSVVYGRYPEIVGLSGRAMIEPQRLAAENVTARLGKDGAQARLSGEVRYAAGDPKPYKSKLDLTLRELDVGALFKLADPDKSPTIEGRFDIRARAAGTGRTLVDLAAHTEGDLALQSRKGVSRLLQRLPPAPAKSSGIVSSVANTAVRVIDNIGEKVGKIVSYSDSTDEIAGMLGEVQFDQLNVRLSRDASSNIRLAEFSLVSPVVRLHGDGLVTSEAGKPLFAQPLKLTLNMGVMGTVEKAMTQAKAPMLSTERDELGYLKSTEIFDVVGTLDKPDSSQLYAMVARSMIGKLLH